MKLNRPQEIALIIHVIVGTLLIIQAIKIG